MRSKRAYVDDASLRDMPQEELGVIINESSQSVTDALFGLFGMTHHTLENDGGTKSFNMASVRAYSLGLLQMVETHFRLVESLVMKLLDAQNENNAKFMKSVETLTKDYQKTQAEFEDHKKMSEEILRRLKFCKRLIKAVEEQEGPLGKPKKKGPKKRIGVLAEELNRKIPKDQHINLDTIFK